MNKGSNRITTQEKAMVVLLRSLGLQATDIVHFVQEGLKRGHGKLSCAERCLELGEAEIQRNRRTVSFARAVQAAVAERKERRTRTQRDFRYLTRKFITSCPGLARRRIRSIYSEECAEWIRKAFTTPSQCKKGRAALSAVFSTAQRMGWCTKNPVCRIPIPHVQEKSIRILTMEEIKHLLATAEQYGDGKCLAAVGIMLYAGVRPHEVARLTWEEVHEEAGVICIPPQHSKTGGGRQVTLHPALGKILQKVREKTMPRKEEKICPGNWRKHWTELHRAAGWIGKRQEGSAAVTHWQPDVLRHTFATHHLSVYRNYRELQVEMGHRDTTLLRTRYLSLSTPVREGIFGKIPSLAAPSPELIGSNDRE